MSNVVELKGGPAPLSRAAMVLALAKFDSYNDIQMGKANWERWLAGYMFLKRTVRGDLYMVAIHEEEGPNPFEGICANFAWVTHTAEGPVLEWETEWVGAQ